MGGGLSSIYKKKDNSTTDGGMSVQSQSIEMSEGSKVQAQKMVEPRT